jgi:hypothetical protein
VLFCTVIEHQADRHYSASSMKWIRYEGHYDRAANKVRSRSVRAMSPPTGVPKNCVNK